MRRLPWARRPTFLSARFVHWFAPLAAAGLAAFACDGSEDGGDSSTGGGGTGAMSSVGGSAVGGSAVGGNGVGGGGGGTTGGSAGENAGGEAGADMGGAAGSGAGGTGGVSSGGSSSGGTGSGGTGGVPHVLAGPIVRGDKLVLEFGDTYFAVDPAAGARVSSFRYKDQEQLSGPLVDANNWGSTFWTSPQTDWNWPPPHGMDDLPYAVTVGASSMTLTSETVTVAGKSLTITKQFSMDFETPSIEAKYTVTNLGNVAHSLAPWEISRVEGGAGLTFFPTGAADSNPYPSDPALPVVKQGAVTWYDGAAFTPTTKSAKLNADGLGGWLAHVQGNTLFLKVFEDVPLSAQAPGEGEIEIFQAASGAYVEVENQGALTAIAPGASITYRVIWLAKEIPSQVTVQTGSTSLLSFVDTLL